MNLSGCVVRGERGEEEESVKDLPLASSVIFLRETPTLAFLRLASPLAGPGTWTRVEQRQRQRGFVGKPVDEDKLLLTAI